MVDTGPVQSEGGGIETFVSLMVFQITISRDGRVLGRDPALVWVSDLLNTCSRDF